MFKALLEKMGNINEQRICREKYTKIKWKC